LNADQFAELYKAGGTPRKSLGLARSVLRRFSEILLLRKYDLIVIQREAMLFGPGLFEWLYRKVGNIPMVLDLDDATYIRYKSPTYGNLGSALKFFGKTDRLIKRSDAVICGNRYIAEYAESKGARTIVIPTVVDPAIFFPVPKNNEVPVVGWIGTHSTFPFLKSLFPVLSRLAERYRFQLKIIGSGTKNISLPGIDVINMEWNLEREPEDFQSLDIGLYPIRGVDELNSEWLKGKSGFKAIQYMAVGVPFVMSPVGVAAEIGTHGETHFNADTDDEWYAMLDRLFSSPDLRRQMGLKGVEECRERFGVSEQVDKLEVLFRGLTGKD
jgi:glycosyltransferase involved in cell wall biosynthesis